jgi:hypothetical protein
MTQETAFGEEKKTVLHRKTKPKILKGDVKYADPPRSKGSDGEKVEEIRKEYAKNADKPTTASGDVGGKDLPQVLQKVDGNGQSQVMPQLYQQMQQITSLLSMGSGSSGGQNGGQQSFGDNPLSGPTVILNDSFTGALAILVRQFGFDKVIALFTSVLSGNGLDNINILYRDIVKNGMANLIRLALYFGPLNIPVSQYDDTVFGDLVPSPLVSASSVPDLYVKQYYTLDKDPFPGYEEWLSPDKTKKVYVKKPTKSYHFSTSSEEIFSESETQLAADLAIYFELNTNGLPIRKLTPTKLNDILYKQLVTIENNSMDLGAGNKSSSSSNSNSMLGGQLQSLISMLTQQTSKPNAAVTSLDDVMQKFKKDMGLNNKIFELGKQALGGGSPLGSLGNMGGISNIMGGFSMGGGGLGGVLSSIGLPSQLGSFGSFGGNSGGGGGAAGSGFGGYTGGNYDGGDVSTEGMKNISQMLQILGISNG